MTQKQFETIKLRLETEREKLEKLYKDTFPFNVKAAYVTCRECGSKISTKVMKERRNCDREQACPVCGSFKDLYSVTASERITKAKARCSKADRAFAEAKKKLDTTAVKNPVDKFKQAVDDVMERLETIYDVRKAPDFVEIRGETGGDLRCLRVYKDGSVGEK